jgi:hypothetical protein
VPLGPQTELLAFAPVRGCVIAVADTANPTSLRIGGSVVALGIAPLALLTRLVAARSIPSILTQKRHHCLLWGTWRAGRLLPHDHDT